MRRPLNGGFCICGGRYRQDGGERRCGRCGLSPEDRIARRQLEIVKTQRKERHGI